ncbi:MAG TPA: FtsX-like permease family protein [Kineosporiaceae bacterium]|nr:FtsX-like permease family protein [Kineosporiaceae bacterium]
MNRPVPQPGRLPRLPGLHPSAWHLPGLHLPGLHLPSIRSRAAADRGPLLLAGLVVALTTLLASAVPQLIRTTADDAVNATVTRAGANAALVVTVPFDREDNFSGTRTRPQGSVQDVAGSALRARGLLTPDLAAAMKPPVAAVTSSSLSVSDHGPGRTFRLTYIAGGSGTRVVWTEGGPPRSTVPAERAGTAVRLDGQRWPVQVGLSQQTAAELGVAVGDRIQAQDPAKQDVEIRVSGIFRAVDPNDPGWQVTSEVLQPVIASDGTGTRIELAGLMSADSLPDGRLALNEEDITRTITFTPQPARLRWQSSESLIAAVVALKASSGGVSDYDLALKWESGLDAVLQDARAQVAAASAQASVLLVGLIVTAMLVLLLAAELLVRRRAAVLAGIRMRGATLAGIALELLIESIAVTLAGVSLGVLLARVVAGGYSWLWLAPVILVAILGVPVLGTVAAASATRGRQAPANQSARQSALRTRQLRRTALEAAVVLVAVGAYLALRQRGIVSAGPDDMGGSLLPAIAPTLGAAVGALLVLRLLPFGIQLALRQATRSPRSLPLFAAARAAATAARPLPFVVLIMSSALLTFGLAISATESNGQSQGAWRTVGANARLDLAPAASVTTLARQLSRSPGVDQAVPARVAENVMVQADGAFRYVRLVVVDAMAFRQLLATTPLPDAPQLDRLQPAVAGARPTALLRSADGTHQLPKNLELKWNEVTIELAPVGTAPAVGDGPDGVLLVDAAAFAATGGQADPNTVWIVGQPAAGALAATAGPDAAVTRQSEVLAERRSAPLAAGLQHLAVASIGVLLLWGLLSVALGALASAPSRGEMLARLRTLGLRSSEARRVAAGELLPSVMVGSVSGVVLGVLLAHASLGLLALRLLTGEATDPALVVPWSSAVPVLLLLVAVVIMVGVESSLRRRERLGQVLRAGNL